MLTGAGPGELFIVRNVGLWCRLTTVAWVVACMAPQQRLSTQFSIFMSAHIIVCGHSHCGAMKALYEEISPEAKNLNSWLDLAREATLPGKSLTKPSRRTEQRSVVLQLERLMDYPMVRQRVEQRKIAL